jgi:uncharacterized protein (DUF4415 family)
MSGKSKSIEKEWVDPDDAQELTGNEMDRPDAKWLIGDREVTPEEGMAAFSKRLGKQRVSIWLDRAVIDHFKSRAGGKGYQTLINDALNKLIESEDLEATLRRVVREEVQELRK